MLPADRFARQQRGGTWRDRFPPDALVNLRPVVAAVGWYVVLALIGFGAAPLVRWAFPGLADGGLPLARGFGLLLVSWAVWMIGSAGLGVGPGTVRLALLALVAAGAVVAWRTRSELRANRTAIVRQLVTAELVFAVFFAICLAVRVLNPDLWHPGHGGEKPMDLSYFTAVLKSVTFPPYDPWFAGGYINYYYFGFVIVGQLALALGIEPAIAYNLAIPTLIGLTAAGAFSIADNLVRSGGAAPGAGTPRHVRPEIAGWAAATAVTLLGNLHPVRMLLGSLVKLGADAGRSAVVALIAGLGKLVSGAPLPIPSHHWFWNPTRIIPDPDVVPITEFPAFTFIYGDLHAHLMDLPQVVAAIAFALAMLTGAGDRGRRLAAVALGALAIGAMRPTNTWSYYPFLVLGMVAVGWAVRDNDRHPSRATEVASILGWIAGFAALTRLLYLPFDNWFGMGYSQLVYWDSSRTPLPIFLEHWGLFLFPIATWLVLELRDWMAATPLAAVRPLRRHLHTLVLFGGPAVAGQIGLIALGVGAAWVVWPMLVAAGLLLLGRELPPARSFALLAAGLGLSLTLVVELVTLRFDLGRMNTVFKFYYVAWVLLAVVAAAALWWRAARRPTGARWRARLWWVVAGCLIAGAALYPITAIPAKAKDRMAPDAPHGLDGSAYLEYAVHHDQGRPLVLAEDLAAIRWLQRHVDGTPTIVEANVPEYRWGSRITVNTGLPGVVGWNWHQRQQRGYADDSWVWERVNAINDFYETTDRAEATAFLARYGVSWIVVGQLERAYYPGDGLDKFPAWDGELWRQRFHQGETAIYEVVRGP
jgi:YYY domain-containing protein